MSLNAVLIAVVAGVLTFILSSPDVLNPLIITNILLGLIVGKLIDQKGNKSKS
ncbi:hypothetical protein [Alkalihalobacillus trypoxylicola]|uniref:hypothetical protein n=1 Tax=Alkalihalobacillus trypoxylicola TaxID=519424 RepID=UPI00043444FC|nr:hypothetical protein [Alkalihalobacillus trypoxylicola]GAF65780.1 hypothetical protein BTS2_2679 [Bacillus sp. TS-2]